MQSPALWEAWLYARGQSVPRLGSPHGLRVGQMDLRMMNAGSLGSLRGFATHRTVYEVLEAHILSRMYRRGIRMGLGAPYGKVWWNMEGPGLAFLCFTETTLTTLCSLNSRRGTETGVAPLSDLAIDFFSAPL